MLIFWILANCFLNMEKVDIKLQITISIEHHVIFKSKNISNNMVLKVVRNQNWDGVSLVKIIGCGSFCPCELGRTWVQSKWSRWVLPSESCHQRRRQRRNADHQLRPCGGQGNQGWCRGLLWNKDKNILSDKKMATLVIINVSLWIILPYHHTVTTAEGCCLIGLHIFIAWGRQI